MFSESKHDLFRGCYLVAVMHAKLAPESCNRKTYLGYYMNFNKISFQAILVDI